MTVQLRGTMLNDSTAEGGPCSMKVQLRGTMLNDSTAEGDHAQ